MVNILDRFEQSFERLVEGSVGRLFRSRIQPAEIRRSSKGDDHQSGRLRRFDAGSKRLSRRHASPGYGALRRLRTRALQADGKLVA